MLQLSAIWIQQTSTYDPNIIFHQCSHFVERDIVIEDYVIVEKEYEIIISSARMIEKVVHTLGEVFVVGRILDEIYSFIILYYLRCFVLPVIMISNMPLPIKTRETWNESVFEGFDSFGFAKG